jgi:hypothetical protein
MTMLENSPKKQFRLFQAWWDETLNRQGQEQLVRSPLYHYTNATGLLGIIKNEEIWLTGMSHLNDPSELDYGLKIACEIIEAEASGNHPLAKEVCRRFIAMHAGLKDFLGFFVSSLSKIPDDLGQWRAYGDNGRGFALGLAPHLFHPVKLGDQKPNERTYLTDVVYGRERAEERFREPIMRAIEDISTATPEHFKTLEDANNFCKDWSTALTISIFWYALQVKHKAYKQEGETRLIINAERAELTPYIDIRSRGSALVPFIRSPMPVKTPGSITEIVIGPSAEAGAEDSLRTLLLSLGLSADIRLWRSDIPYRAL